jgi:hypothetical protein
MLRDGKAAEATLAGQLSDGFKHAAGADRLTNKNIFLSDTAGVSRKCCEWVWSLIFRPTLTAALRRRPACTKSTIENEISYGEHSS